MQLPSLLRGRSGRWTAGVFAVLLFLYFWIDWSQPPQLVLFLGSFHPVLVHFPVGLILLALGMEAWARYREAYAFLRPAVPIVLGAGTVTAVASVAAGWFLSLEGGYAADLLGWHQWLGIAVAVGGGIAWALKGASHSDRIDAAWAEPAYLGTLLLTSFLLVVTGHLGGSLTHGEGFLTRHLPEPVRGVLGMGPGQGRAGDLPTPIDSALVYQDLVRPVLQDRCVECHGASQTEGGLRLDGREQIEEGGDDGAVIEPGSPNESPIYQRITLPLYDEDRMPPEGHEPLSIEHTELIRWWIAHGAAFEMQVADAGEEETPTSVQTMLTRLSRPQENVRTGIYAEDVSPPDSSLIEELADAPLIVRRISDRDPFLEVRFTAAVDTVDADLVGRLEGLAPQIAWFDLSNKVVPAAALEVLGQFPHLTRLYLQGAQIGESGLQALTNCTFLEYVNLVGSNVSDEGLAYLSGLEDLETIYLWKTRVTDTGVDSLRARISGLEVNRGATFVVRDTTAVDTVRTDTVTS